MTIDGDNAPQRFARVLLDCVRAPRVTTVTWLNHYSALRALRSGAPVLSMEYIGIDGIFLTHILRSRPRRTSADTVLPILLAYSDRWRILSVGGTSSQQPAIRGQLRALAGQASLIRTFDGFGGLPEGGSLARILAEMRPNIVIVGLGPDLQDTYATAVAEVLEQGLVVTCGGWLTQMITPAYYPNWAYPLRLNWAVRLAREPRRLWRRYTVEALSAVVRRDELREFVERTRGYQNYSRF